MEFWTLNWKQVYNDDVWYPLSPKFYSFAFVTQPLPGNQCQAFLESLTSEKASDKFQMHFQILSSLLKYEELDGWN